MPLIKSQHKADIDQAQREYWWRKTPAERLAAAARLMAEARQVYAANPANPPLVAGTQVLQSATPISRHLRYPPMPDITPDELRQRQQAGETLHILDVREPWEAEESRLAGSRNIPLGSLPQQLDDLEDLKDQEVIVHCKSGGRSAAAQAFLRQQGFTNVRNLTGGMAAM